MTSSEIGGVTPPEQPNRSFGPYADRAEHKAAHPKSVEGCCACSLCDCFDLDSEDYR